MTSLHEIIIYWKSLEFYKYIIKKNLKINMVLRVLAAAGEQGRIEKESPKKTNFSGGSDFIMLVKALFSLHQGCLVHPSPVKA